MNASLVTFQTFLKQTVVLPCWIISGLLLAAPVWGQNFYAADKLALYTPPGKTVSIQTLADYLCTGQPDEVNKIRALYAWVTLNIAYRDSSAARLIWATPEHVKRQAPDRVLKNRTAVCQGFANLFCALAKQAGMESEVVTGLVKNAGGEVEPIGHAWAAVRVAGEWRLFDPTWGVPPPGLMRWNVEDKFFMAEPSRFILNHLPDDPVWQLLENPVTERQFRESSDEDLKALLLESDGGFKFRDTLSHWIALDSLQRTLASEGRILSFNGSNERVVFGLGQGYWGMFFELRGLLDSLSDEAILNDTLQIDTFWFESQLERMDRYHKRARNLFERLETPERIAMAEKFYTPEDVAALLDKMRGDMRTGVFENLLQKISVEVLNEAQISALRYQAELARNAFQRAEQDLDCVKMAASCFEISHNRSLMGIQIAQRQVRFAQEMANESGSVKNQKRISVLLKDARSFYTQALADCEQMRARPPHFAFVDERMVTARQGLLTLRTCEIRVERAALSPEAEAVLAAPKFPAQRAEKLLDKMSRIEKSLAAMKDTLEQSRTSLGEGFISIALVNLHLESFALQFNQANLRFRFALNAYELAVTGNTYSSQREFVRAETTRAIRALKACTGSLDFLEDSGKLPDASIRLKELQVSKLSKTLRDFQADLK